MDPVQEQIKELGIWLFLGQFCMNYSFSVFLMSASFSSLRFPSPRRRWSIQLARASWVAPPSSWFLNNAVVRRADLNFASGWDETSHVPSLIWARAALVRAKLVPKSGIRLTARIRGSAVVPWAALAGPSSSRAVGEGQPNFLSFVQMRNPRTERQFPDGQI